jgi:hypothetical protein
VERFKTSTIIVCVITYVLSILLLWLADKWDTAGSLYHETHQLAAAIWDRLKGQGRNSENSILERINTNKPLLTPTPDADRRMSV